MLLKSYFEKFVSNIQPSQERTQAASEAHNKLRDHLLEDGDQKYPVSDSFLSGSYARSTAINPIKDVDIIVILGSVEVTDDRKEPSPAAVLRELRKCIDRYYDEVELRTQRRSIRVALPEDDLVMDVVPAVAPNGKNTILMVPDRTQGEWIDSNPAAHLTSATDLNASSNGRFVRAVKAMKWWKGQCLAKTKAPRSFLLERLVADHLKAEDSLVETFAATVSELLGWIAPYARAGIIPVVTDPGVLGNDIASSCSWTAENVEYFHDKLKDLDATAQRAIAAETKNETVAEWRKVFGDSFPEQLSEEENQAPRAERRDYKHNVKISARLASSETAPAVERYPTNGRKLPKKWWIEFRLDSTTVPEPYEIRWAVRNHGAEARRQNQLYHETFPGGRTRREYTLYRGHHFMDCEIVKNDNLVARARHVVNIK